MKQAVLFFILIVSPIIKSYCQQPDISRVVSEPITINPAFSGSYEQTRVGVFNQSQWIGYAGHPETYGIYSDIFFPGINSGFGIAYNRSTTRNVVDNDLNFSYAYNIRFKDVSLQLGTGLNYIHLKAENANIILNENGNIINNNAFFNRLDLLAGLFLYTKQIYFSLSYNGLNLYSDEVQNYNGKELRIITGYHFFKGNKVSFCPSLIFVSYLGYNKSLGINITTTINNKFWVGFAYDEYEAISLNVGIDIWKCYGGFRYSKSTSTFIDFWENSNGMYEIFTGFYFDKNK